VPQAAADRRQHGLLGLDRRRRPPSRAGPRRAKAVLVAQPELDQRRSWYLAHGDWFAGVCLAWCGLCGLVGMFEWRQKRAATS